LAAVLFSLPAGNFGPSSTAGPAAQSSPPILPRGGGSALGAPNTMGDVQGSGYPLMTCCKRHHPIICRPCTQKGGKT